MFRTATSPAGRALAGLGLLLAFTSAAHADDDEAFSIGSRPAWFILGGLTSGATVGLDDRGAYVGGELSVVRLREGRYVGFYGDGYYDFAVDAPYVTGGLEVGYKLLGLDGGVAARFLDDETELGATARLAVSVGLFGIYVRYAYFGFASDSMSDDHVIQVGAALKFPLVSPFGGD